MKKKIIFKFWNVYFFSLVAFYQMCYGGTFWTQINPNDFNFSHRAYQHATSVSGVLSISLCKWITSKSINIGLDWFHWIKIIFFNRMQFKESSAVHVRLSFTYYGFIAYEMQIQLVYTTVFFCHHIQLTCTCQLSLSNSPVWTQRMNFF